MAIVINTNVAALKVQSNLELVTAAMNTAMERLTTGLRINSAADDAAGFVISKGLETQISATSVASDNAESGINMLSTAEGNLDIIEENLVRIRDLTLQAMNGGLSDDEMSAIQTEISARVEEINRVAEGSTFNDFTLFGRSDTSNDVNLQIGTTSDSYSQITISGVFDAADIDSLVGKSFDYEFFSDGVFDEDFDFNAMLDNIDSAISSTTTRMGQIGAYSNRLESVIDQLDVQYQNLSAANSRIVDADIAEESSNYTKNSILQEMAVSLLVAANQQPSIALSLI